MKSIIENLDLLTSAIVREYLNNKYTIEYEGKLCLNMNDINQ